MALTRKFLAALGIDADKVDEIISAHAETVDALKAERDNYKTDADKLTAVQNELNELKSKPDDGYKDKYEKVKKDFDDFKTATENEKTLAAKKTAFTEICKDAGLNEKGVAKAVKYADWDSIELDEEGKVKDAKAHIKSLKEEWAEHVTVESVKGAKTPTPPGNTGGGKTKEEIMSIKDPIARQTAIAENHELFGF